MKKKVFLVKVIIVTFNLPTANSYPENGSGIALHHLKFEVLGVLKHVSFLTKMYESSLKLNFQFGSRSLI